MPNYKNARHGEDIHRELTAIFRSLKDPRIDPTPRPARPSC